MTTRPRPLPAPSESHATGRTAGDATAARAGTASRLTANTIDLCGLPLTAIGDAAADYCVGVRKLLLGQLDASRVRFAAAVRKDQQFALAHAAAAIVSTGNADEVNRRLRAARCLATGGTRRERQHVEILAAVLRGDVERSLALGIEHLGEFPEDVVVLHVISEAMKRSSDPRMRAAFLRTVVTVVRRAARADV